MNRHTRWFRRLLKLLPSDFQADYARDMERTFAAQHRDAARRRGVAELWWETLTDLLSTAPREHAERLMQDARYALRQMRRAPGFTAVAVATLALGIGANTAIFSIVDAVLLRPLPFPDPDRIVRIHERNIEARLLRNAASPPNLLDWKAQSTAFSDIAAYRSASVNLSGRGEPRYLQGLRVSHSFFGVLGTPPTLGRLFTEDEDRRLARVVVVSHSI